ncbi:MAG: substrate-binding domain-containing protein [Clostridiaceae bacterium]|nr:substrate-binding domain-containing protein [Clostridiaceae bacterium]
MNRNKIGVHIVFIIHLLSVIIPVIVILASYFTGSPLFSVLLIVSAVIIFAGTLFQFNISRNMSKIFRLTSETINKAKNGDLKVRINGKKNGQAGEIINGINSFISTFNDVFSNVDRSANEVKHLVNTVKLTSKEASDVANQIAASAELVSKGATEQAEDAEDSAKVTTELIEKFEEVENSAELMTQKADLTKEMAEFGKANINDLLEKSRQTEVNMEEINKRITELNEMAGNISQITATISGIASQTTLLSLNASIEAARAGEMGRGFGVVAEEIKKLAQQSVASSEEINKIIIGIQEQVDITTKTIVSTTETLKAQTESVNKTNEAFNKISDAVDELFAQLLEVKKGIKVLDEFKQTLYDSIANIASVAQETAASTQEITSLMYSHINSSEILVQLSESFDQIIKNLEDILNKFDFDRITAEKRAFAIIPCSDIEFFSDTRDGAMDAASKLGVDVIWSAPSSYDPVLQAKIIDDVVEKGVAGIGIGPIDDPLVRESLKRAMDKGIKVVCFDTDIPDIGRDGFIGTDNYKAGVTFGELVAKKLNGKGRILGTQAVKNTLNQIERLNGFMDAIKKYPGLEFLGMQQTEHSAGEARWQEVKEILKKAPPFDCFICMDAFGSYIAMKMKEELGMTPVCFVFDKTEYSAKPLADGYTTVLAQRPRLWGELSVRRLNELCNGKTIQDKEDTGTYEINKGNMKVFIKD